MRGVVVCFDCDLTLVKCGEGGDGERIGADARGGRAVTIGRCRSSVGAARTAAPASGAWTARRGPGRGGQRLRRRARSSAARRGRRRRGASRELGVCVTNAVDGRTLVHAYETVLC